MVEFDFIPDKAALIIIDMQNAFLLEGASIEVPAGREIIPRIKKITQVFRAKNLPVIYTKASFSEKARGLMPKFWPHVEHSSKEIEIHEDLLPMEGDHIIEKLRYSSFFGTHLDILLRNLNIETVVITGVATNFCCESAARDAHERDYKVIFLSDCNATFDIVDENLKWTEIQKVTLATLRTGFAQIMDSSELLARMQ